MNLRLAVAQIALFLALSGARLFGQPIITDFTPQVGTAGDTVHITGSGFTLSGVKVYFYNGKLATTSITSDSQMTATVPAGITTGPIGIQQGAGPTQYSSSDYRAIGTGPCITDFSPTLGASNDTVVINGVHFSGVTATGVKFNGIHSNDASPNADGTQINVHVPYGASSGPISVTTGIGTSNSPASFTVIGPGAYISDFSPVAGTHSTTVTINGRHFSSATAVLFNGVSVPGFVPTSDTVITVNPPTGVTTGPITVNAPAGNYTTPTNFFVPPVFSSFSPGLGRAGTN